MVKFLVFVGMLYMAGRLLNQQKEKFSGITESEARNKIETKLGPKMGEDKAAELADQIVSKLRDKGVIKAEEAAEVVDAAETDVEDAVDEVTKD
jgi:valyl-tRNA synthetase